MIEEIISIIESNNVQKLKSFVEENKNQIDFAEILYDAAYESNNFCQFIKILSENDTRSKEIILNDIFHILVKDEGDNDGKGKKEVLVNKIQSGELSIEIMDDIFINNLTYYETIKDTIIQKINANDIADLENYITTNQILFSYYNNEKFDFLIYAIENNASNEMVTYIMTHYKSLNYTLEDKTPLKCAIAADNLPLIELLIEKGADINMADEYYTDDKPLIFAINKKNNTIIKYLIDHGAEVNGPTTGYGENPLFTAIRNSNAEIVKYLLDHGSDVHLNDKKNLSFLTTAIQFGNEEIANTLIDHGADVNILTRNGHTPLILAIKTKHDSIAKTLIDHGADVNKQNGYNSTPLTIAIEKESDFLVEYLIEKGANVNEWRNYS